MVIDTNLTTENLYYCPQWSRFSEDLIHSNNKHQMGEGLVIVDVISPSLDFQSSCDSRYLGWSFLAAVGHLLWNDAGHVL